MKKVFIVLGVMFLVFNCTTVPITGRKRVNLVSDSQILPSSFAMYSGFLKENKVSKNIAKTNEIKYIGGKISKSVDKFMRANGMQEEADSYKWEFNLIEDKAVNAWCLPGGKVVFYEGILPICANADGIAAVMAHEIAHAFAKHGQERMTTGYAQQLGGIAVAIGTSNEDPKKQAIWQTVYGIGSTVGMLKYSRVHETEADRLGMVFMIMAGYNPQEAVNVWVRMSANGGNNMPEFLSTHPSHETRIADLKAYMPTAINLAAKYNAN
ncbi:MAG: M48 family metallopeptidase [Flavobacteriaceae bacterium]|nr:M48 family metallopeptidase [Flavobacteriaceae bacterium]